MVDRVRVAKWYTPTPPPQHWVRFSVKSLKPQVILMVNQRQAPQSVQDRIEQSIKKKADPINKNLEKRYQGLVKETELKNKININQSQELIEGFNKTGEFDQSVLKKTGGGTLATVDSANTEINWLSPIAPYYPILGLVVGLGFLWWLKTLQFYTKLYEVIGGQDGLYFSFLEKMGWAKPRISPSELFLYNKAYQEAQQIARSALSVDNKKFSQDEFLVYARMRLCFAQEVGEYAGLGEYLKRFEGIIEAKKVYDILNQIEMSCRGKKQQEFYHFVHTELSHCQDLSLCQVTLQQQLNLILPQVQTEVGREQLTAYMTALCRLWETGSESDNEAILAINIFSQLTEKSHYSTALRKIIELMAPLAEQEGIEHRQLMELAMAYYDDFEVLGDIIELPESRRSPDTYARLWHYLLLTQRHQQSFTKFQTLIHFLRQWCKPYQILVNIRAKHPPHLFRQPQEFEQEILGLKLFQKYQDSLTDRRTGYSYIDFGLAIEDNSLEAIGV